MVCDKLHLICGNCGQDLTKDGMAEWEYIPAEDLGEGETNSSNVFIHCRNCATLHSLKKYLGNEIKE